MGGSHQVKCYQVMVLIANYKSNGAGSGDGKMMIDNDRFLVLIHSSIIELRPLPGKNIHRHIDLHCIAKVFTATPSKNFPEMIWNHQLRLIESINTVPSPPLEKFVDPALRLSTWGPFEEVYNGSPELYIVKVSIDSSPRSNRRKRESHLPV